MGGPNSDAPRSAPKVANAALMRSSPDRFGRAYGHSIDRDFDIILIIPVLDPV